MTARLKSIIEFSVQSGHTVSLPHGLNNGTIGLVPDEIKPNVAGLTLSADSINVTANNPSGFTINALVLCESWHSIERAFGDQNTKHLVPQPFVDIGGNGPLEGYIAKVTFDAFNGDSVDLILGMPVVLGVASGSVIRAVSTSQAQSAVVGLVVENAGPTLPVEIQSEGTVIFDIATWQLITGESVGLTHGVDYFLGDTLGTLTKIPPTIVGASVASIGKALTNQIMLMQIFRPILL